MEFPLVTFLRIAIFVVTLPSTWFIWLLTLEIITGSSSSHNMGATMKWAILLGVVSSIVLAMAVVGW